MNHDSCFLQEKKDLINKDLHYNFVFFFARYDFWYSILGREVYECDNVHVYKGAFNGPWLLRKLFKYHWAYRINRVVNLPLKKIWFKRMYNQKFDKELPLCFVYFGGSSIVYDGGFTDYVKKQDPRNRQVVMHQDLLSKQCDYDYSLVRKKVDLAVSYDLGEANKYNIAYFREDTYSMLLPLPEHIEYESDVFFLGDAKDRLQKILNVYEKLSKSGLKCKFLIAGVSPDNRVKADGIEYISGISYKENIEHVIKTKCVLEIIQGGSVDITTRVPEAIAYRKKLLTDCQIIPREYFNEGQLQVFDSADSIDLSFFDKDYTQEDFEPKIDMNPLRRLYFFQDELEKKSEQA